MSATETELTELSFIYGTLAKIQEYIDNITDDDIIISDDWNFDIPTQSDDNKVLAVDWANKKFKYITIDTNKVFVCTYNSTAASTITNALNNNLLPVCLYNNRLYVLCDNTSSVYTFVNVHTKNNADVTAYYITVSGSTWSNGNFIVEKTSNKVSTINTSSATNYPSVAAVIDYVQNAISAISVPTKVSDLTNDSGFITSNDIPQEVFVGTYGTTTYGQLRTALLANKMVLVYYNNICYVATTRPASSTSTSTIYFSSLLGSTTGTIYILSCSSAGTWTTSSATIPSVSGVNDGTNWTSLTINGVTKAIGGSAPTNMVTTDTGALATPQEISGYKRFTGGAKIPLYNEVAWTGLVFEGPYNSNYYVVGVNENGTLEVYSPTSSLLEKRRLALDYSSFTFGYTIQNIYVGRDNYTTLGYSSTKLKNIYTYKLNNSDWLANASVSNNVLTITKSDGTTVTFAGGGGTPSNMVTTDTAQNISGEKTFTNTVCFDNNGQCKLLFKTQAPNLWYSLHSNGDGYLIFSQAYAKTISSNWTMKLNDTSILFGGIFTNISFTNNVTTIASSSAKLKDLYTNKINGSVYNPVSGINDGTNWTSLTIGNDTYNIPAGGGSGPTNYIKSISAYKNRLLWEDQDGIYQDYEPLTPEYTYYNTITISMSSLQSDTNLHYYRFHIKDSTTDKLTDVWASTYAVGSGSSRKYYMSCYGIYKDRVGYVDKLEIPYADRTVGINTILDNNFIDLSNNAIGHTLYLNATDCNSEWDAITLHYADGTSETVAGSAMNGTFNNVVYFQFAQRGWTSFDLECYNQNSDDNHMYDFDEHSIAIVGHAIDMPFANSQTYTQKFITEGAMGLEDAVGGDRRRVCMLKFKMLYDCHLNYVGYDY